MTYSKTRATKDHTAEYVTSEQSNSTIESIDLVESTPEVLVVPSAAEIRDRFAAPEYVNPNARLPRIQALRGENGASECGYFITVRPELVG